MIYNLLPFPGSSFISNLQVDCAIERNIDSLIINYNLHGNMSEVMMPELSAAPERRKYLWQETCFEFFISETKLYEYWEFNISPAGHWNAYRFSDYRQGMEEEKAFSSLPVTIEKHKDSFHLALDLKLNSIISARKSINVAISAVVKSVSNEITYYALTHKGKQADFHKRESFIIEL